MTDFVGLVSPTSSPAGPPRRPTSTTTTTATTTATSSSAATAALSPSPVPTMAMPSPSPPDAAGVNGHIEIAMPMLETTPPSRPPPPPPPLPSSSSSTQPPGSLPHHEMSFHGQPSMYVDDGPRASDGAMLERIEVDDATGGRFTWGKPRKRGGTTATNALDGDDGGPAGDPSYGTTLWGRPPAIPRVFLSYAHCKNSFFARRLLRVATLLATVMLVGVGVYYFYRPASLVLNAGSPTHYGFLLARPEMVYTLQATPCENMVGFAALVYHAFPAVIILGLPGSGLRLFEPFKREPLVDNEGNRNKIKRTLVFQACEMVGVLLLGFALLVILYFWYMFFNGQTFSCPKGEVLAFALGGALCYAALFVELAYFARYREHIKMTLGAFKESDQTGNVRKHLVDVAAAELMTHDKKLIAVIRKRLYKATRLGDLREMRLVLELARTKKLDQKGFPMKYYSEAKIYFRLFGHSKKNPVHVAAYNGNIEALELLHSYGFELNTLDKFSRVRFSTGDLFWYFAQFFISKPVVSDEENAVSIFKTTLVTPLHCAVSTSQVETVRWLIAHGAEVGTVAQSSYRSERIPPIFLAETPAVVIELLESGANHLAIPDPGFMNTLTALQLAYLRGNLAVAQVLEEWGSDVALTPFHAAAAMNDTARVRKYIRSHMDLNCLGEHGYYGMNRRTPLHWAAVNGAAEVVELLLEAGADPNFQDVRGRTPLHWAARLNRVDIVKFLISKDAQPNLPDRDQMTPLVCAAYAPRATRELFSALVAAGADINYQLPTSGDTALHVAVREENEEAALAVLACGANIMKVNNSGLRPLDCSTDTKLLFEIKRAAGHRDVMISYTHSHTEFAKKLRRSLEDANVTTWLDLMDPSGIGGGSVWREEIGRGITNAALVVCILTEDYAQSEWCLKELALAKQVGTPILAVSTENVRIGEELQVYLYTRQIIPFEPSITATKRNPENTRQIEYDYDDSKYRQQFRLLLDGVRDEVEKRRNATVAKNVNRMTAETTSSTSIASVGYSKVFQPWDAPGTQYVFVSHGDHHSTFVQRLCAELRSHNIAYYGDRNIEGQTFDERIHLAKEAILKCTCFVFLLSQETMNNELVRDQLAFAEDKGRPIFPIALHDLVIGDDKRYSLARTDLYHFLTNGFGFKSSFDQLVVGIKRHYVEQKPSPSVGPNQAPMIGSVPRGGGAASGNTSFLSNSSFVSFVHNPDALGAYQASEIGELTPYIPANGTSVTALDTPVILEDSERLTTATHELNESDQHDSVRNLDSMSSLESDDRKNIDLIRM